MFIENFLFLRLFYLIVDCCDEDCDSRWVDVFKVEMFEEVYD